jgi:hypothetical protein
MTTRTACILAGLAALSLPSGHLRADDLSAFVRVSPRDPRYLDRKSVV